MKKITFIGNLTNDVTLRTVKTAQGEQQVASFSVAANSGSGANKEVEYHNCSAWGKLGVACAQYLHKGSKVYIEGDYKLSLYKGRDGLAHAGLDVTVQTVQFLDPAPKQGSKNGIDAEVAAAKKGNAEEARAIEVTAEALPF